SHLAALQLSFADILRFLSFLCGWLLKPLIIDSCVVFTNFFVVIESIVSYAVYAFVILWRSRPTVSSGFCVVTICIIGLTAAFNRFSL
ncbi:hypothetical protein L9F63_019011, partial [Diploptera punctata]